MSWATLSSTIDDEATLAFFAEEDTLTHYIFNYINYISIDMDVHTSCIAFLYATYSQGGMQASLGHASPISFACRVAPLADGHLSLSGVSDGL